MEPTVAKPDRTLIAIIVIVGVIALLAVIVIFTKGIPSNVDPASPEGVVQKYTQAVVSGDRATAMSLIPSSLGDACEDSHQEANNDIRMSIISTSTHSDNSVVRVMMSYGNGNDVYGGSGYESEDTFTLTKVGGSWLIETSPWQLTVCTSQMGSK